MTAICEKTVKSSATQPTAKDWSAKELLRAIVSSFPSRSGTIMHKLLWEGKDGARFRLNWHNPVDNEIRYTAFVVIRRERDGFIIDDRSIRNG